MPKFKECQCGGKYIEWLYTKIGKERDCYFNEECALHDALYSDGGLTPRKEADEIFLDAMLLKAKDNKFRKAEAYLYYRLVRLFGWAYYNNKELENE